MTRRLDHFAYNSMMSACERCSLWEESLDTLSMGATAGDPVDSDVVSFTSAIGAVQWPVAIELMISMEEKGILANVVAFSSVINSCGDADVSNVSDVDVPAVWPVAPEVWPMALRVLELMAKAKVTPNDVSCNSAIIACGRGGQWEVALCLLSTMLSRLCAVDLYTGYSTVWACETAGEWEVALKVLKLIPETRAKPNVFGCASDVNICYRQGRWQLGLHLINILSEVAMLRI